MIATQFFTNFHLDAFEMPRIALLLFPIALKIGNKANFFLAEDVHNILINKLHVCGLLGAQLLRIAALLIILSAF